MRASNRLFQCLVIAAALFISLGATHAKQKTIRIAVMPFENGSVDRRLDTLGKGLQSMVTTDLVMTKVFVVVERSKLNAIRTELKLGRSKLMDKKTAVKIGKMVGATHLLAGSFTVWGKKMNLNARLFSVKKGLIILATKVEGERDAFFELEKKLVKQLVAALAVTLKPKIRAKLATVMTADFKALRKYSDGLHYYDLKKLRKAAAAMREAVKADASFKIASMKLEAYESVIAKLKNRAGKIRTSEEELKRLKIIQQEHKVAGAISKLLKKATSKATSRRDRLLALHQLVTFPAPRGGDKFLFERKRHLFAKLYWNAARDVFPRVPLFAEVRGAGSIFGSLPRRDPRAIKAYGKESFSDWFKKLAKDFYPKRLPQKRHRIKSNKGRVSLAIDAASSTMNLDALATLKLQKWALKKLRQVQASRKSIQAMQLKIAHTLRRMLRIGESSALFALVAGQISSPAEIKNLTQLLALNRKYAETLKSAGHNPAVREWLIGGTPPSRNRLGRHSLRFGTLSLATYERSFQRLFSGHQPTRNGLAHLHRNGRISDSVRRRNEYWLSGRSFWKIQGTHQLHLGPMTQWHESHALRIFNDRHRRPADSLIMLDGTLTDTITISFDLRYRVPRDWYGSKKDQAFLASTNAQPTVSFQFGIRNVDTSKSPKGPAAPYMAYEMLIDRADISFISLKQRLSADSRRNHKEAWFSTLHARTKLDRNAHTRKVMIKVSRSKILATVNGKALRSTRSPAIDKRTMGFYGFRFGGLGFVELSNVKVKVTP